MGTILDVLKSICRNVKAWLQIGDTLGSLNETVGKTAESLISVESRLKELTMDYKTMDKFGTEGSRKSLDSLHCKFDAMILTLERITTLVLNGNEEWDKNAERREASARMRDQERQQRERCAEDRAEARDVKAEARDVKAKDREDRADAKEENK